MKMFVQKSFRVAAGVPPAVERGILPGESSADQRRFTSNLGTHPNISTSIPGGGTPTLYVRRDARRYNESGLTLLEMMVATTLLVVMMLGLTAMFNQTQRAFRSGLKQVDVFEGGRAVMDMVARDIQQSVRSGNSEDWSLFAGMSVPRFLEQSTPADPAAVLRVNFLQDAFLLNYTTEWNGIGYRVLNVDNVDETNNVPFGSLYRFATRFADFRTPANYYYNLFNGRPSGMTNLYLIRVADGVVHFRLQFYDANGNLIPSRHPNGTVNTATNYPEIFFEALPMNTVASPLIGAQPPNEPRVIFSNTLPAMVEVELGILEPRTLEQARGIPNDSARSAYLKKQAGKVHVFRQQIPIRNATRNDQR